MFTNQISRKTVGLLTKNGGRKEIYTNHTKVIPRREFDLA